MKVIYEKYLNVMTPLGEGIITNVDTISEPLIKYTVMLKDGRTEKFFNNSVRTIISPANLKRYGKLLESESVTTAFDEVHYVYIFKLNNELWYYSYFIDKDDIKHIKSLNNIGMIGDE